MIGTIRTSAPIPSCARGSVVEAQLAGVGGIEAGVVERAHERIGQLRIAASRHRRELELRLRERGVALAHADGEGRREARLQVDDVLAREHDDRLDAGVGERPAELREAGCRRRAMLARRALRPAGHVGEMDGRGGEHDVNR